MFIRKMATIIAAAGMASFMAMGVASADGKAVFSANGCGKCHSAKAAGVMKDDGKEASGDKDLSKVGAKADATKLTSYLKKEGEVDGKKHPKEFKGSEGDLKTLVDWLASLK
jgi:cytochrome c551/c552